MLYRAHSQPYLAAVCNPDLKPYPETYSRDRISGNKVSLSKCRSTCSQAIGSKAAFCSAQVWLGVCMNWFKICVLLLFASVPNGKAGPALREESPLKSRYSCHQSRHVCNFTNNLSKMRQKQAFDTVDDYLAVPLTREIEAILARRSGDIKADNFPAGLAEIKSLIYYEAMLVTKYNIKKVALILAIAMQETYEIRGWDSTKDGHTDGSRNFSVFNLNEDFLNSLRHDIYLLEKARSLGIEDPFKSRNYGGVDLWQEFNQEDGRRYLRRQIEYLNAAFDLWGVTNVLILHRSGYRGLMDRAEDELTTVYVHGIRETTKYLMKWQNRRMWEPRFNSHMLGVRVARYIEHI